MKKLTGYAYILGDDINTDDIVPSHTLTMRDPHEMAKCTLEFIDPNFVREMDKGNIIVAGDNFGTGSSREEAVNVFKILGVKAIIARSFARIYYRNLLNNGIPGIIIDWEINDFSKEDELEISLDDGVILNKTKSIIKKFKKIPEFLSKILEADGILNLLKEDLKKK
ncbi:MAG: LeuD/DmdB family oxidoreductase small subunit [Promethearchaeota archaeon]